LFFEVILEPQAKDPRTSLRISTTRGVPHPYALFADGWGTMTAADLYPQNISALTCTRSASQASPTPMTPHTQTPTLHAGSLLGEATAAILLLHGRGGSAEDILALGQALQPAPSVALLAPQATNSTWYPQSFLAPRDQNEPYLTAALARIAAELDQITSAGIPTSRIVIAGFSQGACLATEFVATHPARYAALIAFTGGLIGPPGSDLSHVGDLAGTPALLLGGDPDPHVPWARMEDSARILTAMGAQVTTRRYPGKPHSVSGEELQIARQLVATAFA
jgi:predicted esterase